MAYSFFCHIILIFKHVFEYNVGGAISFPPSYYVVDEEFFSVPRDPRNSGSRRTGQICIKNRFQRQVVVRFILVLILSVNFRAAYAKTQKTPGEVRQDEARRVLFWTSSATRLLGAGIKNISKKGRPDNRGEWTHLTWCPRLILDISLIFRYINWK